MKKRIWYNISLLRALFPTLGNDFLVYHSLVSIASNAHSDMPFAVQCDSVQELREIFFTVNGFPISENEYEEIISSLEDRGLVERYITEDGVLLRLPMNWRFIIEEESEGYTYEQK